MARIDPMLFCGHGRYTNALTATARDYDEARKYGTGKPEGAKLYAYRDSPDRKIVQRIEVYDVNGRAFVQRFENKGKIVAWMSPSRSAESWVKINTHKAGDWTLAAPQVEPRERSPTADGPWDYSIPEGDDGDDTCIVMHDGDELIEIKGGTLRQRKARAKRIAALLNEAEGRLF